MKTLANKKSRELKIILFFHDGAEHISKPVKDSDANNIINHNGKLIIPWHNVTPHRRKFIFCKGEYLNKDYKKNYGNLGIWGEWEAPSEFNKLENYMPNYPNYIHTRLYTQNIKKERQNTDPYIYGERFKYSNCKQGNKNGEILRNLAKGSLILFGSKCDGSFILDTVFVVNDFINYDTENCNELYENGTISESHYLTSMKPLKDSTDVKIRNSYTLYNSITYEDKYGMYSFFPCKATEDNDFSKVLFSRPVLDIKDFCLSDGKKGCISGQGYSSKILELYKERNERILKGKSDIEIVKSYWTKIVEKIFQQNLFLGIYAEEPKDKLTIQTN